MTINHVMMVAASLPIVSLLFVAGCVTSPSNSSSPSSGASTLSTDADQLLPVDCLLPGEVRKLGRRATYIAARRAIKTSAQNCEIRGGEYTAYDRSNYATALQVWMPLAAEGDKEAQNYIGEIYQKGLGLAPDYASAATWYRKAAEQGYTRAQINLGFLYEKGLGVNKDLVTALNWYRKASGISAAIAIDDGKTAIAARELEATRQELLETRQLLKNAENELQRLKGSSTQKQQDLDKKISALQKKIHTHENLLSEIESAPAPGSSALIGHETPAVEMAGPTIEIVDPSLVLTRGSSSIVKVRSGTRMKEVIGKVTAPAGLFSFSLNELRKTPDKNGLFRVPVPVLEDTTQVKLVAVDKQGKQVTAEFTLVSEQSTPRDSASTVPVDLKSLRAEDFGIYHALIIGNEKYAHLEKLDTAIEDANSVAELLSKKYKFKTTILIDATRYELLSALNQLREKLTDKDNLLIYYAGHGELDKVNARGQWLPVDAEANSSANWISNISITDMLNAMAVKHVLVVADSCYSGALTPSSIPKMQALSNRERSVSLKLIGGARSRTALSSGGELPVLDGGGGKHSVFAKAFLSVLEANQGIIEGQRVYKEVSARVIYDADRYNFDQVPEYAPIQFAGHESGDFLFIPASR